MRKIGLFPGTFDPIHDGHVAVGQAAMDQLDLDMILFLIEEQPWGDKHPVSLKHRRNMLKLAIKNLPNFALHTEVEKHFTLQKTLPKLERYFEDDELYFIFGADVFLHMNEEQWPNLEEIFKHYIVVFERGVLTEKKISEHARNLGIATAIIPSSLPHHSSTDVRLETKNKAIWVSKSIAEYIEQNNLYQA